MFEQSQYLTIECILKFFFIKTIVITVGLKLMNSRSFADA